MFKDYDEFADPLTLPIHGKTYTAPEISRQDGIRLHRWADAIRAGEEHETLTDDTLGQLVLGDAYQQMVDDNVPQRALQHAVTAALADVLSGRAAAEKAWESDPKAPTKPPATKATTTRRRASGTTRTNRKS